MAVVHRRLGDRAMPDSASPLCPSCGEELVLEMDPGSPVDADAVVLSADPPFRYVCASPGCRS
jgi:hypothetical protein